MFRKSIKFVGLAVPIRLQVIVLVPAWDPDTANVFVPNHLLDVRVVAPVALNEAVQWKGPRDDA